MTLYQRAVVKCAMGADLLQTQSLQKPAELTRVDGHQLLFRLRPTKKMLLQSLLPETKTVAIPVQDLDNMTPAVAKDKHLSGKRILMQLVFNQNGQPVDGFAHIRVTQR